MSLIKFADRQLLACLWRPIHRGVVQGIVLPALGRARAFFASQIMGEFDHLKQRHASTMETLAAIEREINTLATRNDQLVARLAALEAEQASQWNNLSKLLLCIYQQPKADVVASPTPHPDEHEDSLSSILIKNSFVVSCETAHRKASFSDLPNIEDPRPGDASRPS